VQGNISVNFNGPLIAMHPAQSLTVQNQKLLNQLMQPHEGFAQMQP
jgi:hypothetical protein